MHLYYEIYSKITEVYFQYFLLIRSIVLSYYISLSHVDKGTDLYS